MHKFKSHNLFSSSLLTISVCFDSQPTPSFLKSLNRLSKTAWMVLELGLALSKKSGILGFSERQ